MGAIHIATIPKCPVHGKMKWIHPVGAGDVFASDSYWICHGFDGEGCDHRVEEKDMDWTAIDAGSFEFRTGEGVLFRKYGSWEE
jgi:hypothetical protein